MTVIDQAIALTPIWVWPLFLIALILGVRNLWTREPPIAELFVLPAILLVFAIDNLVSSKADLTLVVPAFLASFVIGVGVGWNLVPKQAAALKDRRRVRVPGGVAPLLIAIAAVILRYAIGSIYGRWPELRANAPLALEFSATGALLAGIVWGRALRLGRIYARA